jgi:predicted DNA binding CopG/RHH family protein
MSPRRREPPPLASDMSDADIDRLEEAADNRYAPAIHTTLRWSREQLDLIRCAAEHYGMPYQTYVKDAAFRRALEDLQQLGVQPPRQTPSRGGETQGHLQC